LASKLPAVITKFPVILIVPLGAVKTAPVLRLNAPPTLKVVRLPAFQVPAIVREPVDEKEPRLPKLPPFTVKAVVARLVKPESKAPVLITESPAAKDNVPVPVRVPLIVRLLGTEGLFPRGKEQLEPIVFDPV